MRIRISYIILFSCITFFCTDHEDIYNRPYPTIETNAVTNISGTGAQFHGQVLQLKGNEVLDHGFVWGTDQSLSLAGDNKNSMGELEGANGFSAEISTTLLEGEVYYVKAYIKTEKLTIYGNTVSFKSLGSKAPIITDFKPKSGRTLDTVFISGVGFSFIKNDNEAKFGDKKAEIVSFTDTLLKVIVPASLNVLKSKISVSVIGNITTSIDDFNLIGPEISALSTSTLYPCDTLTISGSEFSENLAVVKVFINTVECKIIELKSNSIKILTPIFQPANEQVTLKVVSSNIETIFGQPVAYKKPFFTGLKSRSNTTFNDTVTIVAKNLPLCKPMTIKIGDVFPTLVTYNDSIISFKVPDYLTSAQNTVSVAFAETTISFSQQLKLTPPIITLVSPDNGTFDDLITIHGKNFHPQIESNTINLAGQVVEVLSATPTKLTAKVSVNSTVECTYCDLLQVQVLDQVTSVQNGFTLNAPIINSLSLTTMTAPGPLTVTGENFNPQTELNTVTTYVNDPADFLPESATPQEIVVNIDIYTVSGGDPYTSSSGDASVTVWTGGQTSNSLPLTFDYTGPWKNQSSLPAWNRISPISFVLNDKLYVGLGSDLSSYPNDIWEFDPISNSWSQKSDFPGGGRRACIMFVVNGTAYIGMGENSAGLPLNDIWKYNPVSDTWTALNNFPGQARANAESFSLNTSGYVAGGGSTTTSKEVWKYNPVSDAWQQLTNAPVEILAQNNFVLNNKAYHLIGSAVSASKLYEFNPTTNTWLFKLDVPSTPAYSTSNTAIAGGYIMNGQFSSAEFGGFYKYDPTSNSITLLVSRPSLRWGVISGEILNKQYIFGGFSNTAHPFFQMVYFDDLWEFDYSHYPQ